MDSLSDCLLLRIFKKCQSKDDIWRARTVCKRWYVLLVDSELWQVSNLSKFKLNDFDMSKQMLSYLPAKNLHYLEVNCNVLTSDVVHLFLKEASQLKVLRLSKCTINKGNREMPEYVIPYQLHHVDVRETTGDLMFLDAIIGDNGPFIKNLGLSNSFAAVTKVRNQPFSSFLPNLEILECFDCMWINDHAISDLSMFCPKLVSLNVAKCHNVSGTTIKYLVQRCPALKTLILRRTSVRNEEMIKPKWLEANITELDLTYCYFLDNTAISKAIYQLGPRLEYLRCALDDILVSELAHSNHQLKSLELRRRHTVSTINIIGMIKKCVSLQALDVSAIIIPHNSLKKLLPSLPKLKWFCFAGNIDLDTRETIKFLHHHCLDLENIGIDFSYGHFEETFSHVLVDYIRSTEKLKNVSIEGCYSKPVVEDVKNAIQDLEKFKTGRLKICSPKELKFPQPNFSLINRMSQL